MPGCLELIETARLTDRAGRQGDCRGPTGPGLDLPQTGPLAAICFDTPLGRMVIGADGLGLRALRWGEDAAAGACRVPAEGWAPLLLEARDQVRAYFDGRLRRFALPLAPQGTRFQRTVWGFINEIPYGATLRYGELAALVGSGPRAVARACGANPLPLLIPCHRAVGATPDSGGYSAPGGLVTKRFLLRLEGALDGRPARRLGLVAPTGDARQPSLGF